MTTHPPSTIRLLVEPRRRAFIEWPTLLLVVAIYGGWLAVTWWYASLPAWLLVAAGAWLVCWHSSLQHEILHGHPTRSARVNRLIGFVPLALWLPYDRYRCLHLQHHRDERLTDPLDDPESRYVTAEDWRRLGGLGRMLLRAQSTLLGRLTIGPFWVIATFLAAELRDVVTGQPGARRTWLLHLTAVAAVLAWLKLACGMGIGLYIAAFVIPGTALMLIRSFAEHRAADAVIERTAVVEGHGPLALLFLFNNLHAAHHARPGVPWYRLPAFFAANRAAFLGHGPTYAGYGDVFRRFLWRPHDAPVHPFGRVPADGERRPPG